MILLFAVLCSSLSTWAYDFAVGGIYYDITHSTAPFTVAVTVATNNANSYAGDVTIPASVSYNAVNYSVTAIGTYAFALSGGLTSVSIPTSVTSIESWGFMSCYSLNAIIIPASLDTIGDGAFWGCLKLSTIGIPASVKKIGNYVFFGCTALTDINANAANTHYYSEAGVLYNKDKSTLLTYPAGKPEVSYSISSAVDTIGAYAFSYCQNLTSISIPTSVVYMTHATFAQCNGLTSVFIPASVTFLNNNPFYDCTGMKSVTVDPANLYNESVDGVLFNKGLSTIIYYPPSKVGSSYVIPSTVTYVRSSVFMNCTSLTTVTIPASVRTIRSGMFTGCTGLKSINAYPAVPVDLNSITSGNDSKEVFKGVDTTTCVLHVPVGSKSLYASAFQWKGFSNIVEGFASGLSSYSSSNLKVNVQNGLIEVSGATLGETLVVYSLQGIAVFSQKLNSTTLDFGLPMHGLYLIRVGTENVKVLY